MDNRKAVAAADRDGDQPALIAALEALAATLVDEGDYERAACILGGADTIRAGAASAVDRTRALIEEAIGTVRLAELTTEGQRLSRVDVVALALRTS